MSYCRVESKLIHYFSFSGQLRNSNSSKAINQQKTFQKAHRTFSENKKFTCTRLKCSFSRLHLQSDAQLTTLGLLHVWKLLEKMKNFTKKHKIDYSRLTERWQPGTTAVQLRPLGHFSRRRISENCKRYEQLMFFLLVLAGCSQPQKSKETGNLGRWHYCEEPFWGQDKFFLQFFFINIVGMRLYTIKPSWSVCL